MGPAVQSWPLGQTILPSPMALPCLPAWLNSHRLLRESGTTPHWQGEAVVLVVVVVVMVVVVVLVVVVVVVVVARVVVLMVVAGTGPGLPWSLQMTLQVHPWRESTWRPPATVLKTSFTVSFPENLRLADLLPQYFLWKLTPLLSPFMRRR